MIGTLSFLIHPSVLTSRQVCGVLTVLRTGQTGLSSGLWYQWDGRSDSHVDPVILCLLHYTRYLDGNV